MSRFLVALALACAGLLAWPRVADWHHRRLADGLAARAIGSPASAAACVRELQLLGQCAAKPLVELASQGDEQIAAPARTALADLLTAWEIEFASLGDRKLLGERLHSLSEPLAAQGARCDAAARMWSQRFARRVALSSEYLDAESAWPVLAHCDAVLRLSASSPTAPPRPAASHVAPAAPLSPPVAAPIPRPDQTAPSLAPPLVVAPPIATAPPANLAVILPPAQSEAGLPSTSNPLRVETPGAPIPPPQSPSPPDATSPVAAAAVIEVPSPLEQKQLMQQLRTLSDGDLVAKSEAADKYEAAAARQVLKVRGYSDDLLDLTRELRQLPAPQRRQALERAGELPAAEARRLLRWFVADADADVRLHALTLLSTTGDPRLAEIARQRAVDDADPRVAELGAKLLKQ